MPDQVDRPGGWRQDAGRGGDAVADGFQSNIEHHLFPDLPSNRYAEVAVKVRALFEKYELEYVTGPLPKQVFSAWHKVFRLSLPNKKPKVKTPDRKQELVAA